MIRDCLIPALKSEFAGREIIFDSPPQPIATFPECQAAVGKVKVYDGGEEATVLIEKITHGHFSTYDQKLGEEQRSRIITDDVVEFLKDLFNDRVLLYTSGSNRVGGWSRLSPKQGPVELLPGFTYFLWSRPYKI
ncbi:MAG TPA: hypothetical protein VGR14_16540 [Verrucomicrobiae bacterium]|jgi:hypothetical protein|nr:hypothetical protein [Verrucomicrobiae bacterium]